MDEEKNANHKLLATSQKAEVKYKPLAGPQQLKQYLAHPDSRSSCSPIGLDSFSRDMASVPAGTQWINIRYIYYADPLAYAYALNTPAGTHND